MATIARDAYEVVRWTQLDEAERSAVAFRVKRLVPEDPELLCEGSKAIPRTIFIARLLTDQECSGRQCMGLVTYRSCTKLIGNYVFPREPVRELEKANIQNMCELLSVRVFPPFLRRGVGTSLVTFAMAHARTEGKEFMQTLHRSFPEDVQEMFAECVSLVDKESTDRLLMGRGETAFFDQIPGLIQQASQECLGIARDTYRRVTYAIQENLRPGPYLLKALKETALETTAFSEECNEQVRGFFYQIFYKEMPRGFLMGTLHHCDPQLLHFRQAIRHAIAVASLFFAEKKVDLPDDMTVAYRLRADGRVIGGMETDILSLALQQQGKTFEGLEEDQVFPIPPEWAVDDYFDPAMHAIYLKEMEQAYAAGDLALLPPLLEKSLELERIAHHFRTQHHQILLMDRNKIMASTILDAVHKATSGLFFAMVGAGHLVDMQREGLSIIGIPSLLQQQEGLRLERL